MISSERTNHDGGGEKKVMCLSSGSAETDERTRVPVCGRGRKKCMCDARTLEAAVYSKVERVSHRLRKSTMKNKVQSG